VKSRLPKERAWGCLGTAQRSAYPKLTLVWAPVNSIRSGKKMRKFCLLALFAASQAVVAGQLSFVSAKALADRDEASLRKEQGGALVQSQAPVVQKAMSSCLALATSTKPPAFVVVVELDLSGKVRKTWRDGDSEVARCFENIVGEAKLFSPPRAPFYSSFDMDFNASVAN